MGISTKTHGILVGLGHRLSQFEPAVSFRIILNLPKDMVSCDVLEHDH